MTRLPAYLFVHMARFSWRADINKKAKIMVNFPIPCLWLAFSYLEQRKVKFPSEYDAVDLCSDQLKAKLLPVSRRLKVCAQDSQQFGLAAYPLVSRPSRRSERKDGRSGGGRRSLLRRLPRPLPPLLLLHPRQTWRWPMRRHPRLLRQ